MCGVFVWELLRTHLKNNLSAHGGAAKRFKMLIPAFRDSAFSPFCAPDGKLGIYDLP
jgi:hypothetical protein